MAGNWVVGFLTASWFESVRPFFRALYLQSVAVWAWVGGLLYVLLIILTMIHALMNKRNVRAATGWIGLIWFAPVVGIILYYIFGINRIQRRAQSRFEDHDHLETPEPEHPIETSQVRDTLDPEQAHLGSLSHLTHRLTQFPLLEGNRVEPLFDGQEAYPAMLDALEDAERSITLCSYIFAGSGIGEQFIEKLINANDRGVAVRVIVDDVGARHSSPSAVGALDRAGVSVRRFMHTWLPWRFRYANLRNHRKIMVVDGRIGFTGGLNISRKYSPEDEDQPHRDIHFRLEGPIVSHLQYTFAEDWAFCDGEELTDEQWFPRLESKGTVLARGISHGPDEDYDKLRKTLLGAIAVAEDSIRIVTPYFLPDEELISALEIASMRGMTVEIFVPEEINLRLLKWASGPTFQELLEEDVTIYRTSTPFDHSKLMIVDNTWVLFGSTNWDPRSLKLNFEFNVECYDRQLASLLIERLESLRENASRMRLGELENRSYLSKIRDNTVRLFTPYL